MSRTGLFDSHAHMDSDYFTDDRDALLTQMQEELDGIINPGCDEITSGFAVSLAEKYDFMYAAVGWHPEDLEGILDNSYLDELAAWAVHPKVVAIGEIGLDYYWKGNEPKDVQKRRLLEQLDLAKQFDLPVIIHDRDAHGDILEIFQKKSQVCGQCSTAIPAHWKWRRNCLSEDFILGLAAPLLIKMPQKCARSCSMCRMTCCCLKQIHLI